MADKPKMTFDDVLAKMLSNYENRKDKSAKQVVAESLEELGASQKTQQEAAEACQIIDKIQEKSKSLADAKAQGVSRESWLAGEIYAMTEKVEDEETKQEIVDAFHTVSQEQVQKTLTEDE